MTKVIEFKTERLLLRQWKHSDLAAFSKMSADPEVMKFFNKTLNRHESEEMAEKCQNLLAKNGWGIWAVELMEKNEFIGLVGLHRPKSQVEAAIKAQLTKSASSPMVEILWRLARPYWGHGYATEAAKGCLKVGFNELELEEIVSFAALENVASQAVMKRISMTNSNETFLHPDLPDTSPCHEHIIYRINKEKWNT